MSERLSATISMRRNSTRRGPSVSLSNTSRTVSGPNERLPAPRSAMTMGCMLRSFAHSRRLGAAAHVINVCRNFRSLMERVGLSARAAEWRTLRPHASAPSRRVRRIDAAPFYLRSRRIRVADFFDGRFQLIRRDAEFLRPISDFVVFARADAAPLLRPFLL